MSLLNLCDNMLYEIMRNLGPVILSFIRTNKRIYLLFKKNKSDLMHFSIEAFISRPFNLPAIVCGNEYYPNRKLIFTTFNNCNFPHFADEYFSGKQKQLNEKFFESILTDEFIDMFVIKYDNNGIPIMPIYRSFYSKNKNRVTDLFNEDVGEEKFIQLIWWPTTAGYNGKIGNSQAVGDGGTIWKYQRQEYIQALNFLVDHDKLPGWFGPKIEQIIMAMDKVFARPEC